MKHTDNVTRVDTDVTWNGDVIAISSFSVSYNLNSIPTAQIQLARGVDFATSKTQAKQVDPNDIKEGDEIEIFHNHSNMTTGSFAGGLIFSGVVVSTQTTKATHAGSTSVGSTIQCAHSLSKIGGLPTMSRAHVLTSTANMVVDTYRKNNTKSVATMINSGRTEKMRFNEMDSGHYIVEMMKDLYKSEKLQDNAREVSTEALDELDKIEVADMTLSTPEGAENTKIKRYIGTLLGKFWMNSNGWTTLSRIVANVEGVVAPTATGAHIIPRFPLAKNPVGIVKANSIFGLTSRSRLDPTPVVGVRLLYAGGNSDSLTHGSQGIFYVQYPEQKDKVEGVYKYIQPPSWTRFKNKITSGKVAKPPRIGKKDEPQNTKNLLVKDKKVEHKKSEIEEWALRIAKTAYNTTIWAKNTITLNVPLDFNYAPGMVIEIDVSNDTSATGLSYAKATKLFGQIQSINIRSSVGSFSMTAGIAFVRGEEANTKFGMDTHPLYSNYGMDKIELY